MGTFVSSLAIIEFGFKVESSCCKASFNPAILIISFIAPSELAHSGLINY